MADLFARSGNAWVEPTEVKVRNGVLWQDAEAVYLREGGTWVEKWPLTTLLLPDYVIINLRTTGDRNNINLQLLSRQPDIMSPISIKGGGYYWDPTILYNTTGDERKPASGSWTEPIATNPSTPGWLSAGWVNPRQQWLPEPTQDVYGSLVDPDPSAYWPFNSFLFSVASVNQNFRVGNRAGSFEKYHWNASVGNWTPNNALVARAIPDTFYYGGDIKLQLFINFKLWQEAFPPGHPSFTNPYTLGDVLRFAIFAGWVAGYAPPDPSAVPLNFEILYYKDGTVSQNNLTRLYSVTGASSTQTRNISHVAATGAPDMGPSNNFNLTYDFCAFEINGDFSTGTVNEITTFTNPFPTVYTVPQGIMVNIPSPGSSAPRPQYFIASPQIDTSIYDYRYFTDPGNSQPLTYKYINNVAGGLPQVVSNEADGVPGQTVPDEYLQEQSNFNQEGTDPWAAYPTKGAEDTIQVKWWMHAQCEYFQVAGLGRTGPSSFMFFDTRQFKYDNPTVTSVTLRVAAAGKVSNPSYSLTAQVSTLGFLTNKNIDVNSVSGINQTYISNVTKAITNTVPSGTSNLDAWPLGTGICDITFDYATGNCTVTPL